MMNIGIDFLKDIYKDDIIYHYTKASTAIDYLFYNNQLKFSQARKSLDPIESRKAHRSTIWFGEEVGKDKSEIHLQEANELHLFVEDLEEKFYQICFCQNYISKNFLSENNIARFEGHEEIFGFTKPRMWDQYADKFTEVCIAFSKEKILSLNKNNLDLIEGKVKYLNFQKISYKKVGDIQGNHLKNVGKEKYQKQLEKLIKQSFFYKHIDYSGENEYRIGALFDAQNRSFEKLRGEIVFNRTIMLDISNCVEAIFVSSFANDRQKSDLLKYAEKMNIKIIEMRWQNNSFEPRNFKEWTGFVESFPAI